MAETIAEPARDTEVLGDYDVVVAGGGPAGTCAGLAAARAGCRTLLVEQLGCLGGMATAGLHQKIAVYFGSGGSPEIVGGLPKEIADRAVVEAQSDYRPDGLFVEPEGLKLLLDCMAEESGLQLLYYTHACSPLVEEGHVRGLFLHSKSGRQLARARCLVDCSGDADVAFRAGVPCMQGRDEDGRMQPCTLMFRLGGVAWDDVRRYLGTDPGLETFCRTAHERGLMGPWQSRLMGFWRIPSRPDQVGVNFTHMHLDATSAADLTRGCIEGRRQVHQAVRAMRRLIPGFEHAVLLDTAPYVGIRETRRIHGEYVLTVEDIQAQRIFDDSIGLGAAFIDIHNVEGPGMDRRSGYHLPPGGYYAIPYRTLVPQGVEGLLVAGRCHSATHEAAGSTRWMTQCMVMGQAAGTASALSIEAGTPPRALPAEALRRRLLRDGAILA